LNHGNGRQADNNPIDWPYLQGSFKDMTGLAQVPMPGLQMLYVIKGMQVMEMTGVGIDKGWNFWAGNPSPLVAREWLITNWVTMESSARRNLYNSYLSNWLQKMKTFSPSQMISAGLVDAAQKQLPKNGNFSSQIWAAIPRFRYFGVDQSLINSMADWAKTIWPAGNWDSTKVSTCLLGGDGDIQCSVR
jgi:hypothetical protein